MKRSLALLALALTLPAQAAQFSFVALGDTAYNGERDYPVYQALIDTINRSRPAFTVHVGDIWGVGNCHDWHIERVSEFFDLYDHPLVYTPGDNEWTDCHHRAMGGYDPVERLNALRRAFFASPRSLGQRPMPLVRQADVSPYEAYVENVRWLHEGVLFLTVNVPGSANNYRYGERDALLEAHARNEANAAWIRDGFRIARENGLPAVVVVLHAEMFLNGQMGLEEWGGPLSGPHGQVLQELRLGGERFGKPVLLVHGDSHQFVVDRPFLEARGESEPPRYANIIRLEVFGAPELKAVRVNVDTETPWLFGFTPLYNAGAPPAAE